MKNLIKSAKLKRRMMNLKELLKINKGAQGMKKNIKIYVVLQPHWDPWWSFSPEISEKMGVRNVRKALDIIKENPDFKYVIDQVYLWELLKKHSPERIDELKQRVKEGKIGLTCGGFVNPDLNLPSGESLIRQLAFCKRVWKGELDADCEVVGIMDSFGQSGQLPQIFSKLGLKYHTAKRGPSKDLPGVFIWEGVDGSQIIFDRQPLGHHGISQFPPFSVIPSRHEPNEKFEKFIRSSRILSFLAFRIALNLPDVSLWVAIKGSFWRFKSALNYLKKLYPENHIYIPHGFGFDGAMPFEWIAYFCKMYSKVTRNEMKISLPVDFFKAVENCRNNLIVIHGELNGPTKSDGEAYGVLPGTFSTRIRTKQICRQNERLFYLAELLETIKYLRGGEYRDFTELWTLKFRTDFHDGISVSLTDDNYQILREDAFLLKESCEKIIKENFELLAPKKSVFNPLPWQRKDLINRDGKLDLVEVNGGGFSAVKSAKPARFLGFNAETHVLFTPFYKIEWQNNNLEIFKLLPKGKDRKVGPKITGEKFARIRLQNENGDAYFWDLSGEEWDEVKSIRVVECNDVRATLEVKSQIRTLEITQLLHFYTHTSRIDFETKLNNQEKNIRLQVHLPLAKNIQEVVREIPAGFIKDGESDGEMKWEKVFEGKFAYYDNMRCVQNWIYLSSEASAKDGLAIFNDGLPEHEIIGNSCFITLLRCIGRVGTEGKGLIGKFAPKTVPWRAGASHPIPLAQEQGEHEFRYAFCHCSRGEVARQAYEFLFPLIYCQGKSGGKEFSLISILDRSIIPLAVKKAERGDGVVIRLLETEGREKEVDIKLNSELGFKSAKITNLMEEPISELLLKGENIKIKFMPQEIVTLLLERN